MNKKMLALLNEINGLKDEVKKLADEGKLEDAARSKEKLITAQEKFDLLKDVEETREPEEAKPEKVESHAKPAVKANPVAEFANAARRGFKDSMNEGTQADGGYTVPEDIQTAINKYRDAEYSLRDLVDIENVMTDKGSRTFQKRSEQAGFSLVGEGANIGATATPQFERLDYVIKKYAGYFPVTNELLQDSDAAIAQVLTEWIGGESRVTDNKNILAVVKAKTPVAITDMKGIKKILNVTLGSAFKPTSAIVTNDDGLNWLDNLSDTTGRPLLNPDPTAPAQLQLRCGATVVPIRVIPNSDLASDTTTTAGSTIIPFIIGDLKEGIKLFDRNMLTITNSNVAQAGAFNAFEQDMTLFRAIERNDVKEKDSEAYVYAKLTLAGE